MKKQSDNDYSDLSGKWFCEVKTPAGNVLTMKIAIEQRKNQLTGIIDLKKQRDKKKQLEKKNYLLTGKVKSNVVMVIIESDDTHSSRFVCELLEIKSANKLIGKAVWDSVTNKTITSEDVEWTRIDG